MYRSIFLRLAIAAALLLGVVYGANAQTSRGTLTGIVTDRSGAVIAKATVKITQAGTNLSRTTDTNDAGVYRFDAVDLGTYSMTVEKAGFRKSDTTGIAIQAAHSTDIDITLEVGSIAD